MSVAMFRSAVVSAAVVFGGLLAAPRPAMAQNDPAPRWIVGGTPFFQLGADSFTDRFDRPAAGRTLTIESEFESKPGFGLEGSVGVRVWRGFGIGGSLSFYAPAEDLLAGGEFTARIPHPFDASVDREVTHPAGLKRSETVVHANLLYFIPVSPKLQVVLGAGPSFFRANQTFVRDLEYFEDTPVAPSTVTIDAVTRTSASASGTGFNGSVDVVWTPGEVIGIAGLFRYSRATLAFAPAGRAVDAKAGGLQAGVGLRFTF